MQTSSVALAVPIQPGMTDAFLAYVEELQRARRAEEEAFHKAVGTWRQTAWLQRTPNGDLAVIYWEGEDPARYKAALEDLLRGTEPFGAWVRERFSDIYGVDPDAPLPPLPEPVLEMRFV